MILYKKKTQNNITDKYIQYHAKTKLKIELKIIFIYLLPNNINTFIM